MGAVAAGHDPDQRFHDHGVCRWRRREGHPVYNNNRSDIATLFPGYANSNGAIGYYMLNTTSLANGTHTIAWTVQR